MCVCVRVSVRADGCSARVLRETFECRVEVAAGDWRRLHNEELCDLCFLPYIIRVIKSRVRLTGHVACVGDRIRACRILSGDLKERDHLEDPGVDGRIILTLILIMCRIW